MAVLMDNKLVGDRIKEAAEVLGGMNSLSSVTRIPRRTLGAWVAGETEPRLSGIVEISKHTGKSVNWLSGFDETGEISGDVGLGEQQNKADRIPNLLIQAGMGNGGLEHIEVDQNGMPLEGFTDGGWSLPDGAAKRLGRHKDIYALSVQGDSMEPTYRGGSTVFVDTRQNQPTPPGVFAVEYGDGLLVKRVELVGGTDKIAVRSDSSLYGDYEFLREEVRIWGRVVAKWEWVD